MHSRYRVHDSQRSVTSHLRRNSAISPRYWVIDKMTGETVDEFTTRDTAQVICADMNREHRAKRDAEQQPADDAATATMPGQSVAELERLENLIGVCIRDYKYATKTKDADRASEALKELAEYSAELATLAS